MIRFEDNLPIAILMEEKSQYDATKKQWMASSKPVTPGLTGPLHLLCYRFCFLKLGYCLIIKMLCANIIFSWGILSLAGKICAAIFYGRDVTPWHRLSLIPAWINNHTPILELQRLQSWSLWIGETFHHKFYNGCNYLSMAGLKLKNISRNGVSLIEYGYCQCCSSSDYSISGNELFSCYNLTLIIQMYSTKHVL